MFYPIWTMVKSSRFSWTGTGVRVVWVPKTHTSRWSAGFSVCRFVRSAGRSTDWRADEKTSERTISSSYRW